MDGSCCRRSDEDVRVKTSVWFDSWKAQKHKRHQWQLVSSTFVGILSCSFLGFWQLLGTSGGAKFRIWVDEHVFFSPTKATAAFFGGCIIRGHQVMIWTEFLWKRTLLLWKILIIPGKYPPVRKEIAFGLDFLAFARALLDYAEGTLQHHGSCPCSLPNSHQTRWLGIGMLLLEQSPVQPCWTKSFNPLVLSIKTRMNNTVH